MQINAHHNLITQHNNKQKINIELQEAVRIL